MYETDHITCVVFIEILTRRNNFVEKRLRPVGEACNSRDEEAVICSEVTRPVTARLGKKYYVESHA